ncbi:hypothetical protein [Actinomadura sp. 9N215]|uniref:hypothetical protein n=1 Tax=Actinomadura sp. 9N215 TaxID=3375150 RepID=UPI00378F3317
MNDSRAGRDDIVESDFALPLSFQFPGTPGRPFKGPRFGARAAKDHRHPRRGDAAPDGRSEIVLPVFSLNQGAGFKLLVLFKELASRYGASYDRNYQIIDGGTVPGQ